MMEWKVEHQKNRKIVKERRLILDNKRTILILKQYLKIKEASYSTNIIMPATIARHKHQKWEIIQGRIPA